MFCFPSLGNDRHRNPPQGDEDEPEGHHSPPDVRSSGRGHQRLDRRYLLHAVETNTEGKERSVTTYWYTLVVECLYIR